MGGTTEDELAQVREQVQELARLRYKQRRFTDEQAAQYKALVARRDELALAVLDERDSSPTVPRDPGRVMPIIMTAALVLSSTGFQAPL